MQFHLLSNPGERDHNEDYAGIIERDGRTLFILADGLGGHGKGEVASQSVVNSIIRYYQEAVELPDLKDCIEYAQQQLMEIQQKERMTSGMKTTIVILEVDKERARWAHVGDSRLYMFRHNKVETRTLDHSVPQMLVAAGQIKEKDIRFHEDRNRLLRVMGIEWDKPLYELTSWNMIKSGDAFLLCSDGFWEWLPEKKMEKALKKGSSPREWVELMEFDLCNEGKGKDMDNYSAIAVWI